jgi:hypothetical protein
LSAAKHFLPYPASKQQEALAYMHTLPLWFLVLSLFLPRLCIIIAWAGDNVAILHQPAMTGGSSFTLLSMRVPILGLILTLLIPRILILIWIYQDQGIGLWFLLHVIALAIAWGGGGTRVVRRRRVVYVD